MQTIKQSRCSELTNRK